MGVEVSENINWRVGVVKEGVKAYEGGAQCGVYSMSWQQERVHVECESWLPESWLMANLLCVCVSDCF